MADMGMGQLDDRARDTLDFERSWWKYQGAKMAEVRERVIAYDALTSYWSEVNQSLYFPDRGEELVEEPLGLLVKGLTKQSKAPTTAEAWTSRQRRLQTALSAGVLWRQARMWKVPRRWIVTDLVTVGSPLCHAEGLLATGKTEWEELKETRLVATSPPQPQTTYPAADLHRFR